MNRKEILNILFWITLIVVVILIIWRIVSNSQSDLSIIIGFGLMILFKLWTLSDETKEFKHEVRASFGKVKTDIGNIKTDFNQLKGKSKIKK